MTILATVIVLGVLIFVHELGHFMAAKAVGVEVQRFSIGLGPRVWGFTRGETEYVLSMIPLGGYVKMGGMDDELLERMEGGASTEPRVPGPRDFDAKPIWARTLVVSAGVLMNMIFAFAVYTFVSAYWGVAQLDTTRVGQVDARALPPGAGSMASIEAGARIVSIGGHDVGNWGDIQKLLVHATPGPLSIATTDPGGSITIQVPGTVSGRRSLGAALQPWIDAGVGAVQSGSPADKAGIQAGDRILAVDGVAVHNWWGFVSQIEKRPGQRVNVALLRDGRRIIRPMTLDTHTGKAPDGSSEKIGWAGIMSPVGAYSYAPVSFPDAFVEGYHQTVDVTAMILQFLGNLVTGQVSPRSVGSIVTIGQMSGQAAAEGMAAFLSFMALFSIDLAILNLLPIPILDGGHLLFLGIEAVRGRALSLEQRLRWTNVGLILLAGIMILALSNDFLRLLGR